MTPEEEVLRLVVGLLEGLGVPYMVTGSIASSYHGRPRSTHDADVVVDPAPQQVDALIDALEGAGFFVNADRARQAISDRRQFNAIETTRAAKIDLIVRKARQYSVEEFARRQRVDLPFARGVAMVTPEGAILSKLEWARRDGDSERQIRDASGIVELNPAIDRACVERWAEALGVIDLWRRMAPLA